MSESAAMLIGESFIGDGAEAALAADADSLVLIAATKAALAAADGLLPAMAAVLAAPAPLCNANYQAR